MHALCRTTDVRSIMAMKFWLLQLLGWLPFALVQLLISSDDQPISGAAHLISGLCPTGLAIAGSLVLREVYRRLQAKPYGELRWLAVVFAASIAMALVVDMTYFAGLWAFSGASPTLASLSSAQPMFARAPLVALMYVLWSFLYLALSRQQRLHRAAVAENDLQLALKEAQIQRLLGQLSPHFTFNALNNIRALILKDTEAARDLLAKFASTLRYQFANPEVALVSVADEMAVVRDYLDLLRLQLGNRLQYGEKVDPAVLAMQVPKFALQLLVENAIKHGLGLSPKPGILTLDVALHGGDLQMDVRNTGVLGDRGKSAGHWPDQSGATSATGVWQRGEPISATGGRARAGPHPDRAMPMIDAIIVEDSELARFELEHQLKAHPQIRIIGQAADVDSAVALINDMAPGLIFLDIDLPGGNAFDVLERLDRIPQIIFTTAFDHYALQAFEFNTVDYLLKPIEAERLAKAIEKLRIAATPDLAKHSPDSPLYVKDGERCYLVKPKDIRLIEAVGNYSRLHFGSHAPLLYRSLNAIEERLEPTMFFRASRQHIVNLNYVEQIAPWTNGGLHLTLRGGGEIEVSRRQSSRLKELMSL
ncbi:MAG: LytTR family transcriptional regulator DNA-binding domain-containing protein [Lysobacter sp.]